MVRRTPKPFTVEIRGSRRKPLSPAPIEQDQPHVEWPTALLEELRETPELVPVPQPAPAISEQTTRRILPVLERPAPALAAPHPSAKQDDEPELEPIAASAPPVVMDEEVLLQPADEADDALPLRVGRQPRARRSRDEFARGERWKARLPVGFHKTKRRP